MADPAGGYQNKRVAELDPSSTLKGPRPRLIDEWKDAPQLWDAVRFACDNERGTGLFILTGSSVPQDHPLHSGAGRIGRVKISTMTLQEMGISNGEVSLSGLFGGLSYTAASTLALGELAELIVRGGWPEAMTLDTRSTMLIAASYLDAVAEIDISQTDGVKRDPTRVRKLLASLARNESTLAGKKAILKDVLDERGASFSETTLASYVEALKRIFYIDDIPAWNPALRSPVRIRQAAKHHVADCSLCAAALGADAEALIADMKTFGLLFESLALHDLKVYAHALDGRVMHYHDDSDLEVDAIVETRSGDWGAFEIKLGYTAIEEGVKNVLALERKMVKRGERSPAVKAVIVGVGGVAHMRDDGVQIIPIDTFGP